MTWEWGPDPNETEAALKGVAEFKPHLCEELQRLEEEMLGVDLTPNGKVVGESPPTNGLILGGGVIGDPVKFCTFRIFACTPC